MINIETQGKDIFIFRRENKELRVTKVDTFEPYFYYEDADGEYTTIDGSKASRIDCDNPYEVIEKRDDYSKTFESDVRYSNRYILDSYNKIPKNDIRICYIDIEVAKTAKGWEPPELANNPVTAICCYDSFTKEYKQFCVTVTHDTELEMLMDFHKYIMEINPDLMTGWYSDNFDFPVMFKRMDKLSHGVLDIGRKVNGYKGKVKIDHGFNNNVSVGGRILFDLMYAYKKMNPGGRESYSLDYISRYEGLGGKDEYKGELDDLFKNDVKKYMEYNKRDVELLVLLNEKLNIVNFFDEMRRLCFCKFEDVFNNSWLADALCLKHARNNNFILPRAEYHEQQSKYEGGFVHQSIPGLHKMVACLDFKSLYPSIMYGWNMSYETLLDKKTEDCTNAFDKYYFKTELGMIPTIVKKLLDRRNELKKKMKMYNKNTIEWKAIDIQQKSTKITANALYGVLAFKRFRLYKREIASAITHTARKLIHLSEDWFVEKGLKVIYADTDSVFILMDDKSIRDMELLTKEFNSFLFDYLKQWGVVPERNIVELEFEKVYSTIFFKGKTGDSKVGVKKKYCGLKVWDGDDINPPIVDVVGFESRRSDNPKAGRKFLKEILTMIINEKSKDEVDECVEDFKTKLINELPPEDIAFPIGITKDLDQYGNTIHARAARLGNELHNFQISRGDKIKYIYIHHPNKVIGFPSDRYMPEGYDINYDQMIRRIIDLKVGPLYESLNWQFNYIQINKPKKLKRPEDSYSQVELW